MRRAAAMAVAAAGLVGCTNAPVAPPDLRLPNTYESRLRPADLPPAALDRWWTLFGDPELTDLVQTALVRSPDARTGLQRIAEARATRAQTLSSYLPQGALGLTAQNQDTTESFGSAGIATTVSGVGAGTVSGAGSGTVGATSGASSFLTPSGNLQTYAAQFNISYELDLFGRRRAADHAASADLAAARFDAEAVRATLARDVAIDLFQARGDAIQLADARETLRIARDLARAADISASHGLTSTSDAARLETDVGVDEAEVARLEGALRTAGRTLLTLVGRGADSLASLPVEAITAAPPPIPAATPGELLARRPDVREAEARLQSAAATLKLDRLALFPTFSLAPGGQYARTAGTYESTTSIWSIGLNATLPVLDRPRLLAQIRGQGARAEEAAIAYEQAVQNAYRDAENGLAATAADGARVAALQLGVARARFAFDAKKRGYDLGLVDLTTLLDAERSWRSNLSVLTAAQTTALVDAATLFQALGGGWTPPVVLASNR